MNQAKRKTNELKRREFLKSSVAVAGGLGVLPMVGREALGKPSMKSQSETLATQLYQSLNEKQRKAVCFPFEHKLRMQVENNWFITEQRVSNFYNKDQQDLIKQIFMKMHSEEYAKKVYEQVVEDSGRAGFGESAIAMFGEPGSGKFEFVLTGRHCTRRCDGDTVEGSVFGGPIFYGHAPKFNEDKDHKGNAYWFQAKRANEAFAALDGKQREQALLSSRLKPESIKAVTLRGKTEGIPGLALGELSGDQRALYRKVLRDLLMPFRKEDADEAMKAIAGEGRFDKLRIAYWKTRDIGADGVWDNWQIEGPNVVWYFRGSPHVHVWAHIRDPKHVKIESEKA